MRHHIIKTSMTKFLNKWSIALFEIQRHTWKYLEKFERPWRVIAAGKKFRKFRLYLFIPFAKHLAITSPHDHKFMRFPLSLIYRLLKNSALWVCLKTFFWSWGYTWILHLLLEVFLKFFSLVHLCLESIWTSLLNMLCGRKSNFMFFHIANFPSTID